MFSTVIKYCNKNPRRIFVVDGGGAIASAICLGIIIPSFQDSFGMPLHTLYVLALIAVVFALYSFTCYFFSIQNWKLFLKIILAANALYCLLTAGLVIYYFPVVTLVGLTYFVLEMIIICILIWLESKMLTKS